MQVFGLRYHHCTLVSMLHVPQSRGGGTGGPFKCLFVFSSNLKLFPKYRSSGKLTEVLTEGPDVHLCEEKPRWDQHYWHRISRAPSDSESPFLLHRSFSF